MIQNLDWPLVIGAVAVGVPLMVAFLNRVTRPKKRKGRCGERPMQTSNNFSTE